MEVKRKDFTMSYGAMIRGLREGRRWTQRQLAEAIGCTDGYVAHLENEVKLPSLDICMALAQAFHLTVEDQQRLLEAVEAERRQRAEQRIRTRGGAVRGALRTRGGMGMPLPPSEPDDLDPEKIARDLAADSDLRTAYRHLKRGLADPRMRETVLNALRAFARESEE
jgi:transcriptional regulator with XRE-family HTH domain